MSQPRAVRAVSRVPWPTDPRDHRKLFRRHAILYPSVYHSFVNTSSLLSVSQLLYQQLLSLTSRSSPADPVSDSCLPISFLPLKPRPPDPAERHGCSRTSPRTISRLSRGLLFHPPWRAMSGKSLTGLNGGVSKPGRKESQALIIVSQFAGDNLAQLTTNEDFFLIRANVGECIFISMFFPALDPRYLGGVDLGYGR